MNYFEHRRVQHKFFAFSPSGKVPCLRESQSSTTVWDSLAICEFVAERHPEVWPVDMAARAFARSAASEMHSGFSAIRSECPMNVALKIEMDTRSYDLERDVFRLQSLFSYGINT